MSMVSNPSIIGGGIMDPSMNNTQQANGNGYYNNRRSYNTPSYNNGNGRMNYNNYGSNGSNYFEDWSKTLPADDILEK